MWMNVLHCPLITMKFVVFFFFLVQTLLYPFVSCLQQLGAHSSMDWSKSESSSKVHYWWFGCSIHFTRDKRLHRQWCFQARCAIFGGSGCAGRGCSLQQPRSCRGYQQSHLWFYQQVLMFSAFLMNFELVQLNNLVTVDLCYWLVYLNNHMILPLQKHVFP